MTRLAPALLVLACTGCNLALGISDHEAIPANCGVEAVEGATHGFADVRVGHCYSLVKHSEEANHDFAGNACIAAGGYLACITDKTEFDIINQNVISSAWLGMRIDDQGRADCDSGESFDPTLPIWADGNTGTQGCSAIGSAAVQSVGCGSTFEQWLCEFEQGEE